MPALDWIGKKAVVNHHRDVPYRLVHCDGELSAGDRDDGNLLVQGDNLEALKALLPYYAGKIKCIYIDPPYNTGNEGWVYNDNVNSPEIKAWLGKVVGKEAEDLSRHDKWLCMMYPRLRLLREFLREDGVIFVSIDHNEVNQAALMMREIFGANNHIGTVTIENNLKGRSDDKYIATSSEFLLIFHKGKFETKGVPLPESYKKDYSQSDETGFFRLQGLRKRGSQSKRADRPNMFYPFYYDEKSDQLSLERASINDKKILPFLSSGEEGRWRWGKKTANERINELCVQKVRGRDEFDVFQKDYLENEGEKRVKPKSIWNGTEFASETGTLQLKSIIPENEFATPKPLGIVQYCLEQACDGATDLILDSFAGSGTTGHAVLDLNKQDGGNRKFILIEMEEKIAQDITAKRLKRVIDGYDKGGDPDKPVEGLGGGFRYCRLGVPLFNEFGDIDGGVTFPDLAAHVFFAECGVPIPTKATGNTPLLGTYQDKAVYLLFSPAETGFAREASGNVLTPDMLENLPKPENDFEGSLVVYGEGCTVSKERLAQAHITFKQIPYQIEGA